MSVTDMTPTTLAQGQFGCWYPAVPDSCSQARRDVGLAVVDLGLSVDAAFDAQVMVNELFTNAVAHHEVRGDEGVLVAVHQSRDEYGPWLGIAVTDAGRGALRPSKRVISQTAEGGRGLDVLRGLGARVTASRMPGGYTVFAWFPLKDQVRSRVCRCDCQGWHPSDLSTCRWVVEVGDEVSAMAAKDDPLGLLCGPCRREVCADV
ncbi:MAG TPA: ATP-binding protein [Actinocrinis sp.]|nr:ATP-binding protein [Actinocrinis sp.]